MTRILTVAHTVWLEVIRRKDAYVLFILLGTLLLLLMSLNVFGLGGLVRYVQDVGLLMVWIFGCILAVSVSSRQLPLEETRGTIYPLLAKPITRFELVAGKWLGSWTIVSAAALLFYAMVEAVVVLKGGGLDRVALFQSYLLHCASLGIIAAIGIMFSARMNQDAAASLSYVAAATSFLVIPRVPELMIGASGFSSGMLIFLYNALPHFDVFDMRKRIVHAYGPVAWDTFFLVLMYGALLVCLFILIGWLAYREKRFSRGDRA